MKNQQLGQHKQPRTKKQKYKLIGLFMLIFGIIYIPYVVLHIDQAPYSKTFLYGLLAVYIVIMVIHLWNGFKPAKKKPEPEKKKPAKPKNHKR